MDFIKRWHIIKMEHINTEIHEGPSNQNGVKERVQIR